MDRSLALTLAVGGCLAVACQFDAPAERDSNAVFPATGPSDVFIVRQ